MTEKDNESNGKVVDSIDNVLIFKEPKKGRKSRQQVEHSAYYYGELAKLMCGKKNELGQEFPKKFHVINRSNDDLCCIEELENQVVCNVSDIIVQSEILRWAASHPDKESDMSKWTDKNARLALKTFIALADKIDEPPPFRELSELGLCYHRLPWDIVLRDDFDDAPTWKDLIDRMSNNKAFIAFIGSLFYPKSNKHQYIWIHGKGGEGKSSILRTISDVFKQSYQASDTTSAKSPFYTHSLLGKRVVSFADTNNSGFPATQLFKSLSGDDPVRIEPKFKPVFSARLNCKFIFASNEKPEISPQESDIRRLLYCVLNGDNIEFDPFFEKKLYDEAPKFFGFCKQYYLSEYGDSNLPIRNENTDEILGLISESNGKNEFLFDRYFSLEVNSHVKSSEMSSVLERGERLSRMDYKDFLKWIYATYKIEDKCVKERGRTFKAYKGIKLRPFPNFHDNQKDL